MNSLGEKLKEKVRRTKYKMLKEKIHVSKYKSSKEKVLLSKYKMPTGKVRRTKYKILILTFGASLFGHSLFDSHFSLIISSLIVHC
jgi:hypothetical protein